MKIAQVLRIAAGATQAILATQKIDDNKGAVMVLANHSERNIPLHSATDFITSVQTVTPFSNGLSNSPVSAIVRITKVLCLSMAVLMSVASHAQTPADIDAAQRQAEIIQRQEQEQLQRDQERVRRRPERVEGIDTKSLQPKIEVPDAGQACREISEIVISGAPHLSAVARNHINTEFSGRCLKAADIEKILGQITKDYIDHGYITTRVYLAPQNLTTGRLEILVVEGVVEKIIEDDGSANNLFMGNIFPGVVGNLLNLKDLEQGIDQINRLSSNNAQLDIAPGSKPGLSTVVIRNQRRSPYHFSATYDNQGSESTGKTQAALNAGVDNLLGLNEMFFATHRKSVPGDVDRKYAEINSLNFNIPFGYTTFSMGTSRSKYASTIGVPSGNALVASGDTIINNARLERVMYRNHSTRAYLAATITTKDSRNFLEQQFLGVSSRRLTVLNLTGNLNTDVAGGILTLDLGYSKGLDALGALSDPDSLPDWAPRAQFGKIKYSVNYNIPFHLLDKSFSFNSQLTGQKARTVLFGSEQFLVGGLFSVRGFTGNNTLGGDDGFYLRNELSMRHPLVIGNETIFSRIYAGYDFGKVKNRVANIPQGRISGMVVGVSINVRGFTFDLFNTRPLTLPGFMVKESNQTSFRLTYSL
ncbi:MAG: ShlB/FhaC/HecB family hemolysin secretion/activation protein [Solimicrobium sp.]|jgi:hemolysin activation/secretion protein|nr:ShlB/FhaC/HecB family hemolysin secretion/activation protein [Solimicrobium sp.]